MLKLILCVLLLGCASHSASAQVVQNLNWSFKNPFQNFMAEFYRSLGRYDYDYIYDHLSTRAFQGKIDPESFRAAMNNIAVQLGTVRLIKPVDSGQGALPDGRPYLNVEFRVEHTNGYSTEVMMLVNEGGQLLINGYTVSANGSSLLSVSP